MSKRIFIIGDIHGCYKTFDNLIANILNITIDDDIYLLGDYIDRGPGSKAVVDKILFLIKDGYSIFPIIGNHEQMLLESFTNPYLFDQWRRNGASRTLSSFGIKSITDIGREYIDFFMNLKYYYLLDNYVIVHGGINFDLDDPLKDKYSMVWIRNTYIDRSKIGNRKIIVGHTPVSLDQVRTSLSTDRIMLDGGCVYKNIYPNYGNLCALELNSFELFHVENCDM